MLYHVKLSVNQRMHETTAETKTGKEAALAVVREQSSLGLIGAVVIVSTERITEKSTGKETVFHVENLLDELGLEYETDAPNFRVIGEDDNETEN